jgi:hypothetical protein
MGFHVGFRLLTYNLGRLENRAQRDTDNENDGHTPMNGGVVERVKLGGRSDNG